MPGTAALGRPRSRPVLPLTLAAVAAVVLASLAAFPACSVLPKVMLIPDPLAPEEHLDLGLAYERDGDMELALREYEAAGSLPLAMLGRGNVLFQTGQYRRAETVYRRLLSGDLGPEAANNLAFMLVLENRKPEEAYRLATFAVEEGIKRNLDEAQIRNFKNTLNQAETAMMNSQRHRGRPPELPPEEPYGAAPGLAAPEAGTGAPALAGTGAPAGAGTGIVRTKPGSGVDAGNPGSGGAGTAGSGEAPGTPGASATSGSSGTAGQGGS
jgi:tetratricopeptide (TPR) repeat protein